MEVVCRLCLIPLTRRPFGCILVIERIRRMISYRWPYYTLRSSSDKPGLYEIVDEEGQVLTRDGEPVLVMDEEEAEDCLEDMDLRGTVR